MVGPGASKGYARPTVSIKESLCSTPPWHFISWLHCSQGASQDKITCASKPEIPLSRCQQRDSHTPLQVTRSAVVPLRALTEFNLYKNVKTKSLTYESRRKCIFVLKISVNISFAGVIMWEAFCLFKNLCLSTFDSQTERCYLKTTVWACSLSVGERRVLSRKALDSWCSQNYSSGSWGVTV